MSIVLYFALGIALLSQARFSVTYAGWRRQGIPIQSGLGRRWLVWGLIFLVGIAVVVLLLPTSYTMGPVRAIWGVYTLLIAGLVYLVNLLMFLVNLLIYLILFLLATLFPATSRRRHPLPELPDWGSSNMPPALPHPGWRSWLRQSFGSSSCPSWAMPWSALCATGCGLWTNRSGRQVPGGGGSCSGCGRCGANGCAGGGGPGPTGGAPGRAPRGARPAARERRFLSLRGLSPRELIRFFYVSVARRAGQAGTRRLPGQTPYEFRAELDRKFPDLEPDLEGLTDAFVAARYSPEPVEQEDAEAVKPLWQRVKAALRRRRREKAG